MRDGLTRRRREEKQPPETVRRAGFTLIEVLVALTVVVLAAGMTYLTFWTVIKAWRSGSRLTEDLHYGDFVMDQIVMGLRSTYFPNAGGPVPGYGFWLDDRGSGESAADAISWVKQGGALTDSNSPTASGPHRVQFTVHTDDKGRPAAAVRFWRPYATAKDFDIAQVDYQILSTRIRGFDCRVATNGADGALEWSETWEDELTNRLPQAVELTLYLEPLEAGRPPVEIKRCVEIPVWALSVGGVPPPRGTRIPTNTPLRGRGIWPGRTPFSPRPSTVFTPRSPQ